MQVCCQHHVPAALSEQHTRYAGSYRQTKCHGKKNTPSLLEVQPKFCSPQQVISRNLQDYIVDYKIKKIGQLQTYLSLDWILSA
jgi:hypothetical protein